MRKVYGLFLTVVLSVMIVDAPDAMAQFGIKIPKVPSIGKDSKDSKAPAAKAPQLPPPEVTSIKPDVVPPGWTGAVVFTGKNFLSSMTLQMECEGYPGLKTREFRVENSGSATLQLAVPEPPDDKEASVCTTSVQQNVAATSDIKPSVQGTATIVQVKGPTFKISDTSGLARQYAVCFIAEGELSPEDMLEKTLAVKQKSAEWLVQQMQKGGGTTRQVPPECTLWVSPTSLKYGTILDVPASSVKAIEQVSMFGANAFPGLPSAPSLSFKIVLNNGKIYNFEEAPNKVREQLKRKLKK